jgi:hypothetical protein
MMRGLWRQKPLFYQTTGKVLELGMSAKHLRHILDHDARLNELARQIESLVPLQQAWQREAPPGLAALAVVTSLEGGTVTLRAQGGLVAAKLRQLAPRLAKAMAKSCPEVTEIRVQVATPENAIPARHRSALPLSADTRASFRQLAETLKPSPLRSAVEALLKNRD